MPATQTEIGSNAEPEVSFRSPATETRVVFTIEKKASGSRVSGGHAIGHLDHQLVQQDATAMHLVQHHGQDDRCDGRAE